VYSELNRNFETLVYRKTIVSEIDFILPEKNTCIQVCYNLNSENKERETKYFTNTDYENKILVYFSKTGVSEIK